jgi:hypothetical protein
MEPASWPAENLPQAFTKSIPYSPDKGQTRRRNRAREEKQENGIAKGEER